MNLKTKVVQREKKYAKDLTGANVLQVTDVTTTTDAWDVENLVMVFTFVITKRGTVETMLKESLTKSRM